MARSCTRGDNILVTFRRPLGSITEVTKRLMDNILGIADICNSLNHVHEIGAYGRCFIGSFMALLNSFQMKSNIQNPSSSGAILQYWDQCWHERID
jgi:hypothetical protein